MQASCRLPLLRPRRAAVQQPEVSTSGRRVAAAAAAAVDVNPAYLSDEERQKWAEEVRRDCWSQISKQLEQPIALTCNAELEPLNVKATLVAGNGHSLRCDASTCCPQPVHNPMQHGFRKVGKELPSDVTLTDIIKSMPQEVCL